MIIILNFAPAPPAGDELKEKVAQHVLEYLDPRFVIAPPQVRVIEVSQCRSTQKTLDACGLTTTEWRTQPIIPRISGDHPFAGALLAGVNERRGYEWPTIREV